MSTENRTDNLLDVALEIVRQEEAVLEKLRSALKRGDDKEALHWARQVCGMRDEHQPRSSHKRRVTTASERKTRRFAFEIRMDGETEWRRLEIEAEDLKDAERVVFCIHNLYGYRVIG